MRQRKVPLMGLAAILIGIAVLINLWAALFAVVGQWLWSAVVFVTVGEEKRV